MSAWRRPDGPLVSASADEAKNVKKANRMQKAQSMQVLDELVDKIEKMLAEHKRGLAARRPGDHVNNKRATLRDVYMWAVYRELQRDREQVTADPDSMLLSMLEEEEAHQDAFFDGPDWEDTITAAALDMGREFDPDFDKRSKPS